jgi:hypothetical protein
MAVCGRSKKLTSNKLLPVWPVDPQGSLPEFYGLRPPQAANNFWASHSYVGGDCVERLNTPTCPGSESAGSKVGERLLDFRLRVHDEGASKHDRLTQRLAGQKK